MNLTQISAMLYLNRTTIRRYASVTSADELMPAAPTRRVTSLDPYLAYLDQRWADGCHRCGKLLAEIRERGYRGRGIVRLAGGSRASFYSYFTSKDGALSELADGPYAAATLPSDLGATTFGNLVASIRQFMHAYRDQAPLLLVLDQATSMNPAFLEIRLAIRARFADQLETALTQRSRRRSDPDGLVPRLAAMALGDGRGPGAGTLPVPAGHRRRGGSTHLAVLWARSLGISTHRAAVLTASIRKRGTSSLTKQAGGD